MPDERRPSGQCWNRQHPRIEERARQAAEQEIKDQLQRDRREREEAEAAGMPALHRLIEVARGNTGQPRHVRRFLLGLYNGSAWPFDLSDLRCLSMQIQQDCLAVLRMDMRPRCEVHDRVEDGETIWQEFVELEGGWPEGQ